MRIKLIRLLAMLVMLCLCCCEMALAAPIQRYDCDCEIHLHLLPKSGSNGCFTPTCGQSHTHDYTLYTCFDLENPVCGITGKHHELSCLTDEALAKMYIYNFSVTIPANKIPQTLTAPYVYSEIVTYQSSTNEYYNTLTSDTKTMQMFLLADMRGYKAGDTWASQPANLRYISGQGYDYNWIPAYCCDEETAVKQYVMYKQVNLEDSTYFDKEAVQKIRAVMTNSYPYYTMEEMQDRLAAAGFKDAELIDESVLIAATQMAVWNFSNGGDEIYKEKSFMESLAYRFTRQRKRPSVNAFVPEVNDNVLYSMPDTDERVRRVANYLVQTALGSAQTIAEGQIVISRINVLDMKAVETGTNKYSATLQIGMNTPLRSANGAHLQVTATSESGATATAQMTSGQICTLTLDDYVPGDTVDVTVEGEQYVDRGIYFFEPYTAAGEVRRASQNLVGINEGMVPVACAAQMRIAPSIRLIKQNQQGEPLSGAEFELYFVDTKDENNNYRVATYRSDENGEIVLDNILFDNTYELRETKAPAGYALLSKPVRFSMDQEFNLNVEEHPQVAVETNGTMFVTNYPPVPPTGDSANPGLWMMLLAVSLLGCMLIWRRKTART